MKDLTAVRRAVDRLLRGELGPLLDLLAADVEFCIATGDGSPICLEETGKQPVLDYFTAVCGLVSFWQIDYTSRSDQLIAWGKERFTIQNCELEGGCEFALVFDVSGGVITRLLMVEDLPAYLRCGGWLIEPPRSYHDTGEFDSRELAGVG